MMDHAEVLELIPAYVDMELGIVETLAMERHLDGCDDCRREYVAQRIVSDRFKKEAIYIDAPAHLAARINAVLPQEVRQDAGQGAGQERTRRFNWRINWAIPAAAMATMLALALSIGMYLNVPSNDDKLVEEVIASHVRSLQVDHLSDVVSTDQHTVKPWFNGKLNFAPPVVDLAQQGFPLIGGRLDYLDGRAVAALIYRRQQHPINLYIWPSSDKDAAPQVQSIRGYHLVRWTWDGMAYWTVSDVAASDLKNFAESVRARVRQ